VARVSAHTCVRAIDSPLQQCKMTSEVNCRKGAHTNLTLTVAVNDKPKCWELAATVAHHVAVERAVHLLQAQRLKPGERCANPKVNLRPRVTRVRLVLVGLNKALERKLDLLHSERSELHPLHGEPFVGCTAFVDDLKSD
jgi:hypothetical protein